MYNKDILLLAHIASGYRRRTVKALSRQTGFDEDLTTITLSLNPAIWSIVQGCKGTMYELSEEIINIYGVE